MADKKISGLTPATLPLDGTEQLPGVQGGSNVVLKASDIVHKGRTESVAEVISEAGLASIDLSGDARVFTSTLVEATTFTFDNAPLNGATKFHLILTQDAVGGWLTTLPETLTWEGGVAPDIVTAPNSVVHLKFYTVDGGTTWSGLLETNLDNNTIGPDSFVALADTPSAYAGAAGRAVKVNSAASGLEFVAETPTAPSLSMPLGAEFALSGNPSTATLTSADIGTLVRVSSTFVNADVALPVGTAAYDSVAVHNSGGTTKVNVLNSAGTKLTEVPLDSVKVFTFDPAAGEWAEVLNVPGNLLEQSYLVENTTPSTLTDADFGKLFVITTQFQTVTLPTGSHSTGVFVGFTNNSGGQASVEYPVDNVSTATKFLQDKDTLWLVAMDAWGFVPIIAPLYPPDQLTDLSDFPASYSGAAGKTVKVNDTSSGLAFVDVPVVDDTRLLPLPSAAPAGKEWYKVDFAGGVWKWVWTSLDIGVLSDVGVYNAATGYRLTYDGVTWLDTPPNFRFTKTLTTSAGTTTTIPIDSDTVFLTLGTGVGPHNIEIPHSYPSTWSAGDLTDKGQEVTLFIQQNSTGDGTVEIAGASGLTTTWAQGASPAMPQGVGGAMVVKVYSDANNYAVFGWVVDQSA